MPPGELPPPGFWRETRETFYYHWLNRDPDFQDALRALVESVKPHLTQTILAPPKPVQDLMLEFAARWSLPAGHPMGPLWMSLLWADAGNPLELVSNDHAYSTEAALTAPTIAIGEAEVLGFDDQGHPIWEPEQKPIIAPDSPQPFAYNPQRHSEADLKAYIQQEEARVRESIRAQADSMRQQAWEKGGRRRSPRYYSAAEILRHARRLYLRTVRGLPWEAIADDEEQMDLPRPSVKSVTATVKEWARDLGITLPRYQPGRRSRTD